MIKTLRLRALATVLGVALGLGAVGVVHAAGEAEPPIAVDWSFSGPFGRFDRAQLQRGFQVYKESCAACHGMELVAFRNLADPGGPGFTEEQVKVIAADYTIEDGPDDLGDMFERPGEPKDRFPSPFPNENAAAAANGGAVPPDFSVIAKARAGGTDYIYSLMVGYEDEPPAGVDVGDKYYNHYFPGHAIAMAPPLFDEGVEYTDGTPMTVDNYAKDVSAFLMWAAEPKMEERKRIGFQVIIYLILLSALLYFTKRKIWSAIDH